MSSINSKQAIIGRKPECGHVVAIDLDASSKTRREYARNGYDVLTLPTEEALKAFKADGAQHQQICMKNS